MFPIEFVRRAVAAFCPPGGALLDPFCGRGTVPFVAHATGRLSLGADVNPVAFVYSSVKTDPAPDASAVLARIHEVQDAVRPVDREPENEFQDWAWCRRVLGFLRTARRKLDWRCDRTDRTLMAIILVHLHGKLGNAVSNQMRQSKGMSPGYSVRWWRERGMRPPEMDPVEYFTNKILWRYAKGVAPGPSSQILLGDARQVLEGNDNKYNMLLTSPPYFGVTNYRVDNWIRLWMLGDQPLPSWEISQRYCDRKLYTELILGAFIAARKRLSLDASIWVRTDARTFTQNVTLATLMDVWPHHVPMTRSEVLSRSQTNLFGDHSQKPGETDFLLLPKGAKTLKGFHQVVRRPRVCLQVIPECMSAP